MHSRLQYISQGETPAEQLRNISEALDAGCNWIQLRCKNIPEEALLQLGEKTKKLCTGYKATFIMNDHPILAKMLDADGVHLGLGDMPVEAARMILGDKIIGGTANTFEDVKKRIHEKTDYIGLGPLRFTPTKNKLSPVLGFEGYMDITRRVKTELNAEPRIIAIGGIVLDDIPALMNSGCYGIALSGSITNSGAKEKYVTQLKHALDGTLENRR